LYEHVWEVLALRLSISVTNYSWPAGPSLGDRLAALGERADDAGLDTLWVPDHLVQVDPTVSEDATEMLEAYTTLGFVAARTDRLRLGALVTNVSMRPPALLVKAVTTLDALAPGRAWLGIGAGYRADEAADMGIPLPETRERFERLEETLQVAIQMWDGDESAFEGRYYSLERPESSPRPARRPRILIGGTGEQRTLRLVAQYADACNLFDIPDEGATIKRKVAVLAQRCDEAGRPFGEIEKTLSTRLADGETSEGLARRCQGLAELGIEHLIFVSGTPWGDDDVATLAGAVPLVADLAPRAEGS
jgi:F420-dependent oxidoreductase-like protein